MEISTLYGLIIELGQVNYIPANLMGKAATSKLTVDNNETLKSLVNQYTGDKYEERTSQILKETLKLIK